MNDFLPSRIEREDDNDYYLIDIDCLYDTRLILLSLIDEDYAKKVLEDGSYFKRQHDSFEVIGYNDFMGLYQQRGDNPELLRGAPNTNFHLAIQALVRQSISIGRRGGFYRPVSLVINFFPYRLDKEEVQQVLGVLFEQMAETVEIIGVYIDPDDLTPELAKNQFDYIAMYEGNRWLVHHQDALKDKKYKELFVSLPALYQEKLPEKSYVEEMKKLTGLELFAMTEVAMAPAISLQMIPIELFCIYNEHLNIAKMTDEQRDEMFKLSKHVENILKQEMDEDDDGINVGEPEGPPT